jgi:hypothetical protein
MRRVVPNVDHLVIAQFSLENYITHSFSFQLSTFNFQLSTKVSKIIHQQILRNGSSFNIGSIKFNMSAQDIRIELIDFIRDCVVKVGKMFVVVDRMIRKVEERLRQLGEIVDNGAQSFARQVHASQDLRGGGRFIHMFDIFTVLINFSIIS